MKKSSITINSSNSVDVAIIQKMSFEGAEAFHDGLIESFYPDGIGDDEELDERFLALWSIFLASVGWKEGDFWQEHHERYHTCPKCAEDAAKAAEADNNDKDPSEDLN